MRGELAVRVVAHGQLLDVRPRIVLDVLEDRDAGRFGDVDRDDRRLQRRLAQVVEVALELLGRVLRREHLGELAEHAGAGRLGELPVDGDRPRRDVLDEHGAVAVEDAAARRLGLHDPGAARHGLELQLLLPAHLQEPQAREESPEQGDDDDADDGDPDAAVVAHRVKKEDRREVRGNACNHA